MWWLKGNHKVYLLLLLLLLLNKMQNGNLIYVTPNCPDSLTADPIRGVRSLDTRNNK